MKKILTILLISLLVLTGCSKGGEDTPTELRLLDYVEVITEGNNGVATAQLAYKEDAFVEAAVALGATEENALEYLQGTAITIDPAEALMNGDIITITVVVDEELTEKLGVEVIVDEEKLEFVVADLEGAIVLTNDEIYADIEVEEEGDELVVVNNSNNPVVQKLEFEAKKDGDKVNVTVKVPEGSGIEVEGGVKPVEKPVVKDDTPTAGGGNTDAGDATGNTEARARALIEEAMPVIENVTGKTNKLVSIDKVFASGVSFEGGKRYDFKITDTSGSRYLAVLLKDNGDFVPTPGGVEELPFRMMISANENIPADQDDDYYKMLIDALGA